MSTDLEANDLRPFAAAAFAARANYQAVVENRRSRVDARTAVVLHLAAVRPGLPGPRAKAVARADRGH